MSDLNTESTANDGCEASECSDLLAAVETGQKLRKRLVPLGWVNRENRIYFGMTLYEQAKGMSMSSAELSGYENGKKEMRGFVVGRCHSFWREQYKNIVNHKKTTVV